MKNRANHSYIDGTFTHLEGDKEFDYIVPAFIDIHCHGGGGKYFSEDPIVARQAHRTHGTGTQMASLVTADQPTLIKQIEAIKQAPDIFGIHLEGPYLSKTYCGAHDPALLKSPEVREIGELLNAADGLIKMITFAPELDNALVAIEYVTNRGVIAAIGHSAANATETQNAIKSGATVVTHINNAMAKIGSADSLFSAVIESTLYLEIIEDGHHLTDEDAKAIIAKAPQRIVAITDAMAAAGSVEGEYRIGELDVEVNGGKATLKSNGKLAGSTLTMLDSFINLLHLTNFEQAVHSTSTYPAAALGISVPERYIGIKGRTVTFL